MKSNFLLLVLVAGALDLLLVGCGKPEKSTSVPSDNVGRRFVSLREVQLQEKIRKQNISIPPEYTAILQAVASNDMPAASNAFENLKKSMRDSKGLSEVSDSLLWHDTHEIYGALEQFSNWSPALIEMYGKDILRTITSNGIFFGGTDAGRFAITAFQETTRQPFYVISQAQLVDLKYIAFLRGRVDSSVWLPSEEDLKSASKNNPGNLSGFSRSLSINGTVAKMIFDQNKASHEFWVDQSYAISWMFPLLQPDGLIMKLNPEPTKLTSEMVEEDRRFWDAYEEKLIAHPDYARDTSAQGAFSHMRYSLAQILAVQGQTDAAEYAFKQAMRLCSANPGPVVGLAQQVYARSGRWIEAIALVEEFKKINPKHAAFMDRILVDLKTRQADSDQKVVRPVTQ